jgi:hypothetical protein
MTEIVFNAGALPLETETVPDCIQKVEPEGNGTAMQS